MNSAMHVFVSHSQENSGAAFRICEALQKRNIPTWLDMRDLAPGADWKQDVMKAIQTAAGFVFILGPSGAVDRYQSFEWQQVIEDELYLDASKPLIPVLIGSPELPGFLKVRQSLALRDTQNSLGQVTDGIVEALANPAASVDQSKLELGRKVRIQALESLRHYAQALGEKS